MLSRANAAVCLEESVLGSLQEKGNLVNRGCRAYADFPLPTRTTLRVWVVVRRRFGHLNRWYLFTPLWGNPRLFYSSALFLNLRCGPGMALKLLGMCSWRGPCTPSRISRPNFTCLVGRISDTYNYVMLLVPSSRPTNLSMDPIEELSAQESLYKSLLTLYLALLSLESPKMDRNPPRWIGSIIPTRD